MENKELQNECTAFFERNPYAFETVESLAVRLGRPEVVLESVLEQLTAACILKKLGEGKYCVYRFGTGAKKN